MKGRGELGYDIVDVDAMVSLEDARSKMPDQVILGNVATVEVLQRGSVDDVIAAVTKCHQAAGERYIIGAGCEVPRDTPVDNMFALRAYAQSHKPGFTRAA
jgi:uroporphyrinogen-III decarboxylase